MKKLLLLFLFIVLSSNLVKSQNTGCTDPMAQNYDPLAGVNDGSCTYSSTVVTPVSSIVLDSALIEVSGIIKSGNNLYCHTDEIDTRIFSLDTLTGSILQTYSCGAVGNYNWEDITQDSTYIYIGDFGNNINGNRTDLKILRIAKTALINGTPAADTLNFSYATQTNFNATGLNNTDFDCEAFITSGDSIYLFTKEWLKKGVSVFSMPKTPGTHVAQLRDSFDVQGLITGATMLEDKQLVVLCGYTTSLQPFLQLLYDYQGDSFFSGNKRRLTLNLPLHQVEGIATDNGLDYFLVNEGLYNPPFVNTPQKLHRLELTSYLLNYLIPSTTVLHDMKRGDEELTIYPNPIHNELTFSINGLKGAGTAGIYDTKGGLILLRELDFTTDPAVIQLDELRNGTYLLKVTSGKKVYSRHFSKN